MNGRPFITGIAAGRLDGTWQEILDGAGCDEAEGSGLGAQRRFHRDPRAPARGRGPPRPARDLVTGGSGE